MIVRWLLRLAGIVGGVVAGFAMAATASLGRWQALAVPVFALCMLLGVFLGELATRRPPVGGVRTASLAPRRIRDYVPRRSAVGVLVLGAVLVAFLSVASAVAKPDDQGRPGRFLMYPCGYGSDFYGPWPGSYYAVPILLTVGATALLGFAVLRTVVARPLADAVGLSAERYRRRTAATVTATLGVVVAVSLTGTSVIAYPVLTHVVCAPPIAAVASWFVGTFALVGLLAIGFYLALLIAPVRSDGGGRAGGPVTARADR